MISPVVSPVYGPVRSWRFGRSLGIDPIGAVSTCSFNCVYCQLGDIQVVTAGRREFIPTARLAEDLERVDWGGVDVITFSGSGEPTLATNLAEMIHEIKRRYKPPVHILTNATLFNLPEVRESVLKADVVACKLDAPTDAGLRKINRPAEGITVGSIVEGILKLKSEYKGLLELQIMFMPLNVDEAEALAKLIRQIGPAQVQLNTPKRPYPLEWHVETRGEHEKTSFDWPTRRLTTISVEEANRIEDLLRRETGVPILSIYHA